MINTLLRLCLLMLSNLGYWTYFHKKWEINVYFLPAFTIAAQVFALFLPGILNFLGATAWVIYLLGFLLLVRAMREEKTALLKPYITGGYLLLAAGLLAIAICVRGRLFTWIDCFTHWAVAAKSMLDANQFPTFAQSAVTFSSYPLGSTTYIYYFCNMTSAEEDVQMLAQAYMLLSMLLALFSCGRKTHVLGLVFFGLLTNFLLCYNIPVTELLVDTLLPLTGMAAILFIFQGCQTKKPDKWSTYAVLPLLFLTINIKTAGIFYAVVAFVLMCLRERRDGRSQKPVLQMFSILVAAQFLWSRHCDYVFLNAADSQHALSISYLASRFAERSLQDIWQIVLNFAGRVVSRQEHFWLLLWLGVLWGLTWIADPKQITQFARMVLFCVGLYALYLICLIGMYGFSMGVQSALDLESFDRYMWSIDIALYYLFSAYALDMADRSTQPLIRPMIGVLMIVLLVCTWKIPHQRFDNIAQIDYDPQMRLELKGLLDEYGVPHGATYLICYTGEPDMYPMYVCRYYLDTGDVGQITVTESAQMEIEKEYDYLIIYGEDNPVVDEWIQEHYPSQAGNKVIQCLK